MPHLSSSMYIPKESEIIVVQSTCSKKAGSSGRRTNDDRPGETKI